jgi:hypothetical protein
MKAVARQLTLDLQSPLSLEELESPVQDMMLRLAGAFSVRGVVPGHIKALVEEGESYGSFSCTKPDKVNRYASPQTKDALFHRPRFYLNIVLVGVPEEKVAAEADASLDEFLNSVRSGTGSD